MVRIKIKTNVTIMLSIHSYGRANFTSYAGLALTIFVVKQTKMIAPLM